MNIQEIIRRAKMLRHMLDATDRTELQYQILQKNFHRYIKICEALLLNKG